MGGETVLGDLLTRIEVGVAGGVQNRPAADGEWGVLRLSAMTSDSFTSNQSKRLISQAPLHRKYEVHDGDVLMVRVNGAQHLVGATRSVRGAQGRLVLSDLLYRLVPDEDRLAPGFLALLMNSDAARRQIRRMMRGSSGQFQLPQSTVMALVVRDVPMDEQHRIVAAHAAFERRISGLERVRGKLREAARATLAASLLDSALGERVIVGDVLRRAPKNGYSPKPVPGWTGLQALGLGCLTVNGFAPVQLKNVPDTPLARSALLSDGDLLMSRANTRELVGLVGRYESIGRPCIYPDLMMRLRPDEDLCLSEFLEIVLRSDAARRALTAGARGTSESMVKISADLVQSLNIPLPCVDDQRRIVNAQAVFERRIGAITGQIDKLRTVQQAVVEDLLGGRALDSAA
ncbi:hypothetical protein ACWFRM_13565 [Streptomyces sp. NPDC055144]